jgi:hypothetical protein
MVQQTLLRRLQPDVPFFADDNVERALARAPHGKRVLIVLDHARTARHIERPVPVAVDALILVTCRAEASELPYTIHTRSVHLEVLTPEESARLLEVL